MQKDNRVDTYRRIETLRRQFQNAIDSGKSLRDAKRIYMRAKILIASSGNSKQEPGKPFRMNVLADDVNLASSK